jgi:glycosyltransferase involved in cell wall biosynthesis
MRFTIATVTYNAAATLPATLRSVLEQTYHEVEFLLIDGASSDDTLRVFGEMEEALRRHCAGGVRMLSERDGGLYDAMNKALRMATGDYLIFLNAGDRFHAPTTLHDAARLVSQQPKRPSILYGQTDIVDAQGAYLRPRHYEAPAALTARDFLRGMLVCHQAFWPATALCREVSYDLRYHYSADYDWCIRLLRQGGQTLYTGGTLIDYLDEGMTTRHRRASLRERFRIMHRHYGLCPTLFSHLRILFRTSQRKPQNISKEVSRHR